jgi:hypothetical protein
LESVVKGLGVLTTCDGGIVGDAFVAVARDIENITWRATIEVRDIVFTRKRVAILDFDNNYFLSHEC